MKIGDTIIHKKKNIYGKVVSFMKRNPGVLVDYSDHKGVMCRWTHIKNIEVVFESG